jgi:hypothetical protein
VSVRIAPRTLPAAAHGCGPAPVKRAVRVGTERRLRWAVGEPADPPGFGPGVSRSESWAPSSCLLSDNGEHASLVRRRSGFDSPGRLHADVAQWSERVT